MMAQYREDGLFLWGFLVEFFGNWMHTTAYAHLEKRMSWYALVFVFSMLFINLGGFGFNWSKFFPYMIIGGMCLFAFFVLCVVSELLYIPFALFCYRRTIQKHS